jgi:hypothetical protein
MKCTALRLSEEFRDLDDVRYLLRYLNESTSEEALAIVLRYFDAEQILPRRAWRSRNSCLDRASGRRVWPLVGRAGNDPTLGAARLAGWKSEGAQHATPLPVRSGFSPEP